MSLTCQHRSKAPLSIEGHAILQPVFGCDHPKNRTKQAMIQRVPGVAALQCIGCPLVSEESEVTMRQKHWLRIASHDSAVESNKLWEWVSIEQMMRDVRELLLPKLPTELSGVAGCPRSGMVAASQLSLLLHLPLYAMGSNGPVELGSGGRGRLYGWGRSGTPCGPLLVIEDSTYSGGGLAGARRRCAAAGVNALFAAMYHRPQARHQPDLWARELEAPHLFEWHCFNSGHMSGETMHPELQRGSVLDMDGIVCADPTVPDSDEGGYSTFLQTAAPLWTPRIRSCRAILTARLERYRPETEAWLQRHGARYNELVMMNVPTYRHRGDVAAWKAAELARLSPSLYFESSERQARLIHSAWGGVVVCPAKSLVLRAEREVVSSSGEGACTSAEFSDQVRGVQEVPFSV